MAERPPVAAAALARRGPGRAGDHGRRPETGVTIHETVKELDAGPIAAQRAFPIGPEDDAGAVYARAAELAAELLDEVLPEPAFRPQEGEATLRGEDRARPTASSTGAARRRASTASARSRRTSARAASCTAAASRCGGAARGRRARPARGAAGGRQADGLRRVPPRPAVTISPARRAAFEVLRRVFEEDAYADRAFAHRLGGPRRARPRARPAARLRDGAAQADARPRDRDARQAAGAQARPAGARGAPARRLPARLPRRRPAVRRRERVGRARAPRRLERAVPFTNAVLRRLADGIGPLLAALPEGPLKHSYPDWVAEVWRRDLGEEGGSGAHAGAERAAADGRPPRPGPDPRRAATDIPGAYEVERVDEKALQEARSGRRAAARSSPGSPSAPPRASACSTSAPRPAGRRRCSRARSSRSR